MGRRTGICLRFTVNAASSDRVLIHNKGEPIAIRGRQLEEEKKYEALSVQSVGPGLVVQGEDGIILNNGAVVTAVFGGEGHELTWKSGGDRLCVMLTPVATHSRIENIVRLTLNKEPTEGELELAERENR